MRISVGFVSDSVRCAADLGGVAPLVGTHYEIISKIFRMLGANVGKRIYWPGSGLDLVEFDLLTVGDDVVFGSRSTFQPCDGIDSSTIAINSSAMVADRFSHLVPACASVYAICRCYLKPGVRLGKGAVLGSGSLAKKGGIFEGGSVWVGSLMGNAIKLSQDDNAAGDDGPRPFGKAFYDKQACSCKAAKRH